MSNYINELREKKEALYKTLLQRYAAGRMSPRGFTDLLDLIYIDVSEKSDYADTVALILKIKVQTHPRISDIYELVQRDDLWQALESLEVNPAYFIATCADYVIFAGHLRYDFNRDFTSEINFGGSCQSMFNVRVVDIKGALKVFYD